MRWTFDDRKLVSTGGADTSLMVWSHQMPGDRENIHGDSDDSDTDSEEEGASSACTVKNLLVLDLCAVFCSVHNIPLL